MARRRGLLALCLLAAAAALATPPSARADGDPASDFLPTTDSYLPVQPPVSKGTSARLAALLRAARAQGNPFKVAVIGSTADLGAVPILFGKPDSYAKFLSSEIQGFLAPGGKASTLLVVMPAGMGIVGPDATAAARAAIARVKTPAGSDQLTDAASMAVTDVARANGHPLPAVAASGGGGGSHAGRWAVVGAIVVLLAAGAGLALRARRRVNQPARP